MRIENIPAPPTLPDSSECCGSGCVPCIFDYYFIKLGEWEDRYGLRLAQYERKKRSQGKAESNLPQSK